MGLESLVARLKIEEGKRVRGGRHMLYKCPANKWTLGYGRNVEEHGISETDAHNWLVDDARDALLDAASLFPSWLMLDEVRRDVLADMSYNLGRSRLAKFKDLIAAVEASDWPGAKAAMIDSAWYGQVGQRAVRLAEEMRTGVVGE